jgi:guanylate kinase
MLFIISAPSGSGKSTLVAELRKLVENLEFSISYTTRKPRGSEQNGREYFFVTRDEFESMLGQDEFLEHAEVFGNYYGTARRFLREAEMQGNDLLLDIDVQGAAQIKQKMPRAVSIFVLPPSRQVLEQRLLRRSQAEGVADQNVIQRRLHTAAQEIENWPKYDYILVNDRLEDSIDQLKAIVLCERARAGALSIGGAEELCTTAGVCRTENARERVLAIQSSFAVPAAGGKL